LTKLRFVVYIKPGTGQAEFYLARDVAIIESKRKLTLSLP
jgi:hypothetical protein